MVASNKRQSRVAGGARGAELLRQVYAELYACLGQQYSPAELLKAAQGLIDLRNQEYTDRTYQEELHYSGYYSHAVDRMIERPWLLLENEPRCEGVDDDLIVDAYAQQRLRRLLTYW